METVIARITKTNTLVEKKYALWESFPRWFLISIYLTKTTFPDKCNFRFPFLTQIRSGDLPRQKSHPKLQRMEASWQMVWLLVSAFAWKNK